MMITIEDYIRINNLQELTRLEVYQHRYFGKFLEPVDGIQVGCKICKASLGTVTESGELFCPECKVWTSTSKVGYISKQEVKRIKRREAKARRKARARGKEGSG